ncbi:hypothetical protein ACQY0O_001190 [Thecaphora frezii]
MVLRLSSLVSLSLVVASLCSSPTLATAAAAQAATAAVRGSQRPPNFIYILSDDQDANTATADIMPHLARTLAQPGSNYTSFYVPMSICCPSRVGFLRSQHGHSHNVTYVNAPFGGWERFVELGYRDDSLPSWLQAAGYDTYYTGKLMNGNTIANAQSIAVHGFNQSKILLDPNTYAYLNASYSTNGGAPETRTGEYSTDHIRDVGLQMLDAAAKGDRPFFLGVAPIGPHADSEPDQSGFLPPVAAKRHAHLFEHAVVPRSPNFNPQVASGAYVVRNLARLNQTQVDYFDDWYRLRLRSLQAVDELIGAIVDRADQLGLLHNTYIVYSSDNGYSIGSHRRQAGKTLGYEDDIRVPFFVRGPTVPKGEVRQDVHTNIDLSASIAHLAGAAPHYELEGRVMPWTQPTHHGKHKQAEQQLTGTWTHHLSEYWVYFLEEGKYAGKAVPALYRSLRVKEDGANWAYVVWCNGERELYDMVKDPYQLDNLLAPSNGANTASVEPFAVLRSATSRAHRLATRFDTLLLNLKNCKGASCRQLWRNLFPHGEVQSLEHALSPKYDDYFDAVPRLHYSSCQPGFRRENERPDWNDGFVFGASGKIPSHHHRDAHRAAL